MKELRQQSNFCSRPWNELHIEEDGKVTPCCVMPSNRFPMGDSLEQYSSGSALKQLKEAFIRNEKHPSCEWCWKNEELGLKSHRRDEGSLSGVHSLHIRFSNVCNLKCRMCNPSFSSTWAAENNKHKIFKEFVGEVIEKNVFDYDPTLLQFLGKSVTHGNLRFINISGGEPLITDANYTFLKFMVDKGLAEHLQLSYSTNLMKLDYKNYPLVSLWKQFRKVSLEVSVDGWGKELEYGRTGVDKSILLSNIIKAKPFISAIHCVVNSYSVWSLPTLERLCKKLEIPLIFSPCQLPPMVNPQLLMPEDKEALLELYKDSTELTSIHKNFISQEVDETALVGIDSVEELRDWFCKYNLKLDKYRNTNFFDTFPMYKKYYRDKN